jgi:hypothetical protein
MQIKVRISTQLLLHIWKTFELSAVSSPKLEWLDPSYVRCYWMEQVSSQVASKFFFIPNSTTFPLWTSWFPLPVVAEV